MSQKYKSRERVLPNGRSAPKKERGVYLRYEMLKHPKFHKLSGSAVKVLLELCTWHNGFNNRKISCSCAQLAEALHLGKATVLKALSDLEDAEFIVCVKRGYFTGRQASVWEVTFLRSEGYQPTDLWKDPEQRPNRPNFAPIKKDLIQEIREMPEIKKGNVGTNSEREDL
jgi:hypothetical protein